MDPPKGAVEPFGDEITTHLVELFVEVEGVSGRSLGPEDFELEDDDRPQQIVTVSTGDVPFSSILVLDSSASMAGDKLELMRSAARRMLAGLGRYDRLGLVAFADRPRQYLPIDSSRAELEAALERLRAEGGTALFDALFLSTLALEGEPGHRSLILVSDGSDLHSYLGVSELRSALRSSRAQLFWIRPLSPVEAENRRPLPGSWRTIEEAHAAMIDLERLVEESGGRVLEVSGFGELQRGIERALQLLRERVAIGYAPDPPPGTGEFRTWKLRIKKKVGRVRAPLGWFDPAPSPGLPPLTP